MISAVLSVVNVIKQGNCPLILLRTDSAGYLPLEPLGCCRVPECSTWNKSSFQNVKYGIGSSPSWISVFEKSIDWRNRRGGVPVFNRHNSKPISLRESERLIAATSPARPPDCWFDPICKSPRKKVPVVT